jgi:ABC-type multidrug transport system fused ATPase/permease subunit
VSFTYKGSKTQIPAITGLSCLIRPGQLVVIVGANGSGKTSLTKLLTRLYEPTSGTVLVDGRPAKSFKLRDLRRATATLSQDHQLFEGLSIAENISIGRWESASREDFIETALRLGGAHDFVKKMTSGSDTVLHPVETKDYWGLTPGNKLLDVYNQLEKASDVSGM